MAKIRKIQSSFTSGEISPRLYGRIDLGKYSNGLEQCLNFIVSPYGGLVRRPGTRYVGQCRTMDETSRLVRFEYSNSQSYILEFNNGTIRFFKDQGLILQGRGFTNGTFDSDITSWTSRNSGTGAIAYSSGKLQLTGAGSSNEARAYQSIAYLGISTHTVTVDIGTSNVVYRVGTSVGDGSLGTGTLTTGTGKTFTFVCTTNQTVYIEFEASGTATVDNVVLSSPQYVLDIPYTNDEIPDLRFAQSFDTLYIAHGSYPTKQLVRYGHDYWVLSNVDFEEPAYLDMNTSSVTLTPSGTTGSITVTASAATFTSTDIGRAIRYKAGPDKTDSTSYTGTGTQVRFDIPFYPNGQSDVEVYKVAATGVKTLQTYTTHYTIADGQVIMVTAPTASERLIIQPVNAGSGEWGWMTITAYGSATSVTATIERELAGTNASLYWRLGAWSDTTGYPYVVTFHEQRLWFANTDTQPQSFWASEIGNYTNFQPDNALYKGDVDDDTSFSFTIGANKSQAIMWIASKGAGLIGTANGVYSIKGINGAAISATNVSVRPETSVPCAFMEYADTANEIIFIERLGKKAYSIAYTYEIDGYMANELTLLAEHLGHESPIEQVVFQNTPTPILWFRRTDGTLLSCTYIKAQEVSGWAKHELGGTDVVVESLATIPGSTYTELWLSVSRTINSSTVRYIEFLTGEFFNTAKEDGIFMDCSATYDSTAATTISGLGFLEGESVTILADGAVHPNETVTSSAITLDSSSSVVQIGLGYTSSIRTLTIEGGSVIGTSQSALSRILEASVRFYETIGGKIGYNSSSTDIIPFRNASDLMDESPELFSGYKTVKFPHGFENGYQVFIKQDQPLPMSILSIIYKADVSDS